MTPVKSHRLAARLASVILGFEAIVMFLGGLVVFGLKAVPFGLEQWWGVVGGVVFAVLLLLAAGAARFQWGIVFGWVLQVLVFACALINGAFLFVGLVFGGMWAYAMITAARIARKERSTESE